MLKGIANQRSAVTELLQIQNVDVQAKVTVCSCSSPVNAQLEQWKKNPSLGCCSNHAYHSRLELFLAPSTESHVQEKPSAQGSARREYSEFKYVSSWNHEPAPIAFKFRHHPDIWAHMEQYRQSYTLPHTRCRVMSSSHIPLCLKCISANTSQAAVKPKHLLLDTTSSGHTKCKTLDSPENKLGSGSRELSYYPSRAQEKTKNISWTSAAFPSFQVCSFSFQSSENSCSTPKKNRQAQKTSTLLRTKTYKPTLVCSRKQQNNALSFQDSLTSKMMPVSTPKEKFKKLLQQHSQPSFLPGLECADVHKLSTSTELVGHWAPAP